MEPRTTRSYLAIGLISLALSMAAGCPRPSEPSPERSQDRSTQRLGSSKDVDERARRISEDRMVDEAIWQWLAGGD
jgi:hypothetical protein